MKKLAVCLLSAFLLSIVISAADAPANPFDRFDKEIKKLEEKQGKEKDKKKLEKLKDEITKVNDNKDKALKKLTAPFEAEREKLVTDIDKAKEKDKNADTSVKQARLDYVDKMLQYYNDLYAGKAAELPKEPSKTPATPAKEAPKEGAKTDAPAADPMGAAEKAKDALAGDLAK